MSTFNEAIDGLFGDDLSIATMGLLNEIEEENRSGGGPGNTTKLSGGRPTVQDVGYKITLKIATSRQWWEREYYVEQKKNINVFARFMNKVAHSVTARAYARFKTPKMINNGKKVIVSAEIKNDHNED